MSEAITNTPAAASNRVPSVPKGEDVIKETQLKPQPLEVRAQGGSEKAHVPLHKRQVLEVRENVVWRSVLRTKVSDSLNGPIYQERAAGKEHRINKGQIFETMDQLVAAAQGNEEGVKTWLRKGIVVFTAIESMGKAGRSASAPLVLGNTTGNSMLDQARGFLGESLPQNDPSKKWGMNPANAANYSIEALQAMIADKAPEITPPNTMSDCINLLCQDFIAH